MNDPTHRWTEEMKGSLDALKTMRDELKVQVHLLGMEAKQRFDALEKRFDNEQLAVKNNVNDLIANFRVLKEELARQNKPR